MESESMEEVYQVSAVNKPEPWQAAKWLFFDMGGTLIDETPARMSWCAGAAEATGGRLTTAEVYAIFHRWMADYATNQIDETYSGLVQALVEESPSPQREAEAIDQLAYPSGLDRLYPAAPVVLARLSQDYSLGIIANQSPGSAGRLERLGVLRFFDVVVASAEAGLAKPDRRIFQLALTQAGCAPAEAVMIGDRLDNDIYPAKALGLATIRLRQGISSAQEPVSPGYAPDLTLDALDQLPVAFGRGDCHPDGGCPCA